MKKMKFAKFLYLFFLLILCFNSAKTEEKVVIELQIGSEILK